MASDNSATNGNKGVALVTGGGSGIGRASALALCAAGYKVVIVGRRVDALDATIAAASGPGQMVALAADVTNQRDVEHLVRTVVDRFGRIDLLFNNAGMSAVAAPMEDVAFNDFMNVVNVNLIGAFLVAQAVYRQMIAQNPKGGRIINNGSISAYVPRPNGVAYNMTKHSISGLTKSLSLEGRNHNVACGQIDIGNTATDMTEKMERGMLQADGSIRPEPTFPVQHVADAVLYMANLPLNANVQFMTVMASHMPYIGRG